MADHLLVDAARLKGLTHPLRLRLLAALGDRGRATATQLATDLDESTGATSYHLRQLHTHGFIEEAQDVGNGRERWWRPVTGGWTMPSELGDDPATAATAQEVLRTILAVSAQRTIDAFARIGQLPAEWQQLPARNQTTLRLDPAAATRFAADLAELVQRYRAAEPGPGARRVNVETIVYPTREEQ